MPVTVEVSLGRAVRKPALLLGDQFRRQIAAARQLCRRVPRVICRAEEDDRRSAPVIDQNVHQAIFVEVAGQTSHRCHGRSVEGERRRFKFKGLIARRRAGRWGDDHLVGARVDVTDVI